MKYIDEFRDPEGAKALVKTIHEMVQSDQVYRFMEFCGGHTHTIARYGLEDILPSNIHLLHGPGCPVCVLPMGRIDMALQLVKRPNITLCTYADLMRIPSSNKGSLFQAQAHGADIRMVYSPLDALKIAQQLPEREIVFFAIGFETTTPPTALIIDQARKAKIHNFSVFCNHVLTPPAIKTILSSTVNIDGFLGPSHVSVVIGTQAYDSFATQYNKAIVVAGFEPLDVLQSILMLVKQINSGHSKVENQYRRAVTRTGNLRAQETMKTYFMVRPNFEWRGLGLIPNSARQLRPQWASFDAEQRFGLIQPTTKDNPACVCGEILRGIKTPLDCKLFGTACTPEMPIGSCMVSNEGTCAAFWAYRRNSPTQTPNQRNKLYV